MSAYFDGVYPALAVFSVNKKSGFTLIELLVVISIITILSTVGLVSYNGIRGKAMDAKIKSDLNSIKKAYETKYDSTLFNGQGGYKPLADSDFASGKIPTPDGTSATSYFISGPNFGPAPTSAPNFYVCASLKNGVGCPSSACSCAVSTQGMPVNSTIISGISTSGLTLWLKADDIDLSGLADGTSVGTWKDRSGNNYNATQSTSSKQPQYQSTAINSMPALRFSAVQQQIISVATNFSTPYTVLYVARQNGSTRARVLSAGNNWLLGWWNGSRKQAYFEGWVTASGGTTADSSVYLYSAVGTGSNSTVYENGTQIASNANGLSGPNSLVIGGWASSEFSDADVAEVILYNQALADADRKKGEQYLGSKYGITISN